MLDYVIRSATLIDGTAEPGRRADVGIRDGRRGRSGTGRRARDHRARRRRPGGDARCHRPAHALRRPALLGPLGVPLQRARRDHGDRGQLRVHPRAHQRRRRGLHPTDDGQGRGHAPGCPGERRPLELVQLRRVPRRPGRSPGRQRRVPGGPLCAAPQGHGGAAGRRGCDRRRDRRHARALGRVVGRRGARLLVLAVAHPLRRGGPAHQLAICRPARDARLLRGGGGARGHDPRVHHQRLPRQFQPRRRWIS